MKLLDWITGNTASGSRKIGQKPGLWLIDPLGTNLRDAISDTAVQIASLPEG
jgi:hypothetical protein